MNEVQAERIAAALEGIETALVVLAGKGHGTTDSRLTDAELDEARRVIQAQRRRG